jgi:hypothetical protein
VAIACDGVNDPAALAQADLGRSMGTDADADVAIEASDADAIHLSQRTLAPIKGTLFWGVRLQRRSAALAVAGLLGPMLAEPAMEFSSLFVVANSRRLRRFQSVTEHDVEEARSGGATAGAASRLNLHAGVNRCSSLPSKPPCRQSMADGGVLSGSPASRSGWSRPSSFSASTRPVASTSSLTIPSPASAALAMSAATA